MIGNTIDFVQAAKKNEIHLLLQDWAEEYGEIMRVQVGPMTSYYLNSDQAVKVRAPVQCGNSSLGQWPADLHPFSRRYLISLLLRHQNGRGGSSAVSSFAISGMFYYFLLVMSGGR